MLNNVDLIPLTEMETFSPNVARKAIGVVNKVAAEIERQGGKCYNKAEETCLYIDWEAHRKCAIGILLGDDLADRAETQMHAASVGELLVDDVYKSVLLKGIPDEEQWNYTMFLQDVQRAHDCMTSLVDFGRSIQNVLTTYRLA